MNYTPCSGNPRNMSAMMYNLGVPLNYKKHMKTRCVQIVELIKDDPISSNTMNTRTVTMVAAYPRLG